jgi:metabotropic X receptor
VYDWVNVGFFHDDQIEMNMEAVQFQLGSPSPPPSICSADCYLGLMKKYVEGESCCWTCHACGRYEVCRIN